MSRDNAWECKVGFADWSQLPPGSDLPMREAVRRAFCEITGHDPLFVFSGWSAPLTETEKQIVAGKGPA